MNPLEFLAIWTIAGLVTAPAFMATIKAIGAVQADRAARSNAERLTTIRIQHPHGYRPSKGSR